MWDYCFLKSYWIKYFNFELKLALWNGDAFLSPEKIGAWWFTFYPSASLGQRGIVVSFAVCLSCCPCVSGPEIIFIFIVQHSNFQDYFFRCPTCAWRYFLVHIHLFDNFISKWLVYIGQHCYSSICMKSVLCMSREISLLPNIWHHFPMPAQSVMSWSLCTCICSVHMLSVCVYVCVWFICL